MQSLRLFVARTSHFIKAFGLPALIISTSVIACSYKTPGAKTPVPNPELMAKSALVRTDASGAKFAKTFMCGWAPINEVGFISEWTLTHSAHGIPACNIQFEITRDFIIGYQVNPSVEPTTVKNGVTKMNWAKVITIPIKGHCTPQVVKDKHGRPTNETICDTSKDDPLARSHMDVNWSGLEVHDWAYEMLYGGTRVLAVRDMEQTEQNSKTFIGFTLSVTSPYFGRHHQADIRMNFLEIAPESVTSFPPRLYHDDNSVHFGTLWGLGKQIEGENPISFVGRWDMRPEALPHNFCLNGFEDDAAAKRIAIAAINEWNDVFARNGITPKGKSAFSWSERKFKHDFDLRCNSFTYVSDPRISAYSPLGIAMAQADVVTGKILWGGMVVYGGALKKYVENYRGRAAMTQAPTGAVFSERENRFVFGANPLAHLPPIDKEKQPFLGQRSYQQEKYANYLREATKFSAKEVMNDFVSKMSEVGVDPANIQEIVKSGRLAELTKKMNSAFARRKVTGAGGSREDEAAVQGIAVQEVLAVEVARLLNVAAGRLHKDEELNIANSLEIGDEKLSGHREKLTSLLHENNWPRLLVGRESSFEFARTARALFGDNWRQLGHEEKEADILRRQEGLFKRLHKSNIHDIDNTIADLTNELRALPGDLRDRPVEDIVEVTLKKTLLHEFGHIVGLAHNFKENIMPRKGTVPEKAYEALEKQRDKMYHQNSATIMGYPHAYMMVVKNVEDVKVGPQDELVLHYLYKNEYAVYSPTAAKKSGQDIFEFRQVPGDGRIPSKKEDLGGGYRVSYFENCTDLMEWFGLDPYCNRWDRGYDAKTIVQGYIDDYDRNNIKKLENLADTGLHPYYAQYSLWARSLDTFTRIRKFYDHMRYTYRREIKEMAQPDDSKNLYSFEKCNGSEQTNTFIKGIFDRSNPEFADLCEANLTVVRALGRFMRDPGPDFNTYSNEDMAVPVSEIGNDDYQSFSRMHGTWQSLGVAPMKISALLTLTMAAPYRARGAWLMPVWKYTREGQNTKYTYASLYPQAFTQEISEGVISNLKFVADNNDSPQMGRVSLLTGLFLSETFRAFDSTNDYHVFAKSYMKTLREQTNFLFNYGEPLVPVLIQVVKDASKEADPERVKTFNGLIYLWGNNSIPLGDVYMLPEGQVFFRATPKMFVYPVSEIFFIDDTTAVVWGIRVSFNVDNYSDIRADGTKQQLHNKYGEVIESCLKGSGLKDYFSAANREFKGFKVIPGIATNETRYREFTKSVGDEFKKYAKDPKTGKGKSEVCGKALDDVGLIVTQALAMIGAYMPQITEYLYK